jgi:hypothetical protein
MRLRSSIAFALVAAAGLGAAEARAADPIAEQLYQSGVALMREGKFDQGCPKVAASHRREPLSGTLMTLAQCHELQGKSATAWGQYEQAAMMAEAEGRSDYETTAKQRANALAPKLSKITVQAGQQPAGAQLSVAVDGRPLRASTLGSALPLDPGEHEILASAPGYVSWSMRLTLGPEADAKMVIIPPLQKEAAAPPPAAVAAPTAAPLAAPPPSPPGEPSAPAVAPPPGESADQAAGAPTWPWGVGGVGVALGVVAIVFAVDQQGASGELNDQCGSERGSCPAGFDFEAERDRELRSFGLFAGLGAASIVALGVATVGLVISSGETAGEADSEAAELQLLPLAGPNTAGGMLVGSF